MFFFKHKTADESRISDWSSDVCSSDHCEAYYEPTADRVTMPAVSLFDGFDHYYATLAHELSHWTGHTSRLGRDLKNRFGTAAYAAEELVAELSSAMLG